MKLPAFQFYPGDWRKDAGVQSLDFETRGVWFELLCLMHESERRGVLILNGSPMGMDNLARLLGISHKKLGKFVEKLEITGVLGRDEKTGAIVSRRMVRDEAFRQSRSACGKLGGNPVLIHPELKVEVKVDAKVQPKVEPTPSSSSSSSASALEAKASCSEPEEPAADPTPEIVMEFPCVGPHKFWPLSAEKLEQWQETYPDMDVPSACRKARQWCMDNPSKKKTSGGMTRFIGHWLSAAQNKGEHSRTSTSTTVNFWTPTHPDAFRPQDEVLREAFQKTYGDDPKAKGILAKLAAMENGQPAPL